MQQLLQAPFQLCLRSTADVPFLAAGWFCTEKRVTASTSRYLFQVAPNDANSQGDGESTNTWFFAQSIEIGGHRGARR